MHEPCYDSERVCDNCGGAIARPRQEAALRVGRIPTYCSDVCSSRAASRRYHERRGKQLRRRAKLLTKFRAQRRKMQKSVEPLLHNLPLSTTDPKENDQNG